MYSYKIKNIKQQQNGENEIECNKLNKREKNAALIIIIKKIWKIDIRKITRKKNHLKSVKHLRG